MSEKIWVEHYIRKTITGMYNLFWDKDHSERGVKYRTITEEQYEKLKAKQPLIKKAYSMTELYPYEVVFEQGKAEERKKTIEGIEKEIVELKEILKRQANKGLGEARINAMISTMYKSKTIVEQEAKE